MATTIVGLKIRETRRALGISQSELARRMGISPAYLNLIEFSKRRIGGRLLKTAADCLDLQPSDLDGAAELRLVNELREIAVDPGLQSTGVGADSIEAFVGRFPEWAAALAQVHRSDGANRELATALSDRLNHDPYLGDIVHQMLTHISAIRSTSEILDDIQDIDPARRERFHDVLVAESHRLTDVAQALAGYFDKAHTTARTVTPVEEIESFLLSNGNHFPAIEIAVEEIGVSRTVADTSREGALIAALDARNYAIAAEQEVPEDALANRSAGMDRPLSMSVGVPRGASLDTLARAVVDAYMDEPIAALLGAQPEPVSAVARQHITALLKTYAADALLMPARPFLESAERLRYDLDALSRSWAVEFDGVCRRLTAVRAQNDGGGQGDGGPRFAYFACNAAGHTIDRRPLPDLPFPRHGAACPLWSIYRSFASPETVIRQVAQFPDGEKMLFVARARRIGPVGFDLPADYVADMIAVPAKNAGQLVYGDGIDFGSRGNAEPVGPNCRICPREGCRHRTDDPLVGRFVN